VSSRRARPLARARAEYGTGGFATGISWRVGSPCAVAGPVPAHRSSGTIVPVERGRQCGWPGVTLAAVFCTATSTAVPATSCAGLEEHVPTPPWWAAGGSEPPRSFPPGPGAPDNPRVPLATPTSAKTLLTLVVPAARVLAAAGIAPATAPESPWLARAADGYPLVAMATCVLLAWRLQRSRLLIVALVTACAVVALEPRFNGYTTADMVVAATLPLGFALLSITADRPISAPRAYLQ